MIWLIISVLVIINEYDGGEKWVFKALRNLMIVGSFAVFAQKNPGTALMLSIIIFCAFMGYCLYRYEHKRSAKASCRKASPQRIR